MAVQATRQEIVRVRCFGRVIDGRKLDLEVTYDGAHPQTMLGKSIQVRAADD